MAYDSRTDSSSNGAIIGLAIACVMFMGLLGFIAWFVSSRQQKNGIKSIGNTNDITPTPGTYHEYYNEPE